MNVTERAELWKEGKVLNNILEISVAGFFILYILFEFIKINFLKKDNGVLLASLASMLLFGFGLYLWIKYGLILDYGTKDEIINLSALLMFKIALISLFVSLMFILTSIFKLIKWRIKQKSI